MQRRKDKRIQSSLLVAFSAGPMEFTCRSKTLSAGGIYIATPHPPPVDTHIWIGLHLDDGPNSYINVEGVVRYRTARRGMGVQFVNLRSADKQRIQSCVESHWWQEV